MRRFLKSTDRFLNHENLHNPMSTEVKQLLDEMKIIKDELKYIKQHMPDKDMFLTAEEKKLLEESHAHQKEGKTMSSAALRKKLGI